MGVAFAVLWPCVEGSFA